MTDFLIQPRRLPAQDGAGRHADDMRGLSSGTQRSQHGRQGTSHTSTNPPKGQGQYPPPPSASSSPAKSKFKSSSASAETADISGFESSLDDTRELQDSIIDFPTQNQPVMDTTLKDMLVSLRSTLHADMLAFTQQFKTEVAAVDSRVTHIESKMGEFTSTFNDLVDAHNERDDEIHAIKTKLADLEDRSRRNNVKIRGIPELIKPPDLKEYFTNIMKAALPEAPLEDLIIDRIHRLPRPRNIPDHLPRDTIVRIHFYHIKDQFMMIVRRRENLPQELQGLSFYADLSAFTMQQRRQLATITKPLNNHHIQYRWLYPAKLLITKEGKSQVITNIKEGICLLREWQLIDPSNNGYDKPHSPSSTRASSDTETG